MLEYQSVSINLQFWEHIQNGAFYLLADVFEDNH